MTNEVAQALELTAEAAAKLKPGEAITIEFSEPMWPMICWLGILIILIALLVLLVRSFIWWHRRQRLGLVAAARGRFCGWLASRLGLLGLFIAAFLSLHGVRCCLYSCANTAPSAARETQFLIGLYHVLFTLGFGLTVFLAGWLQAFAFEWLWRRWELRRNSTESGGA
jgi:hypothetical protein